MKRTPIVAGLVAIVLALTACSAPPASTNAFTTLAGALDKPIQVYSIPPIVVLNHMNPKGMQVMGGMVVRGIREAFAGYMTTAPRDMMFTPVVRDVLDDSKPVTNTKCPDSNLIYEPSAGATVTDVVVRAGRSAPFFCSTDVGGTFYMPIGTLLDKWEAVDAPKELKLAALYLWLAARYGDAYMDTIYSFALNHGQQGDLASPPTLISARFKPGLVFGSCMAGAFALQFAKGQPVDEVIATAITMAGFDLVMSPDDFRRAVQIGHAGATAWNCKTHYWYQSQ